jgi:hypothetical protein
MLKAKEATKDQRETIVRSQGCVWRLDTACRPFSSTQSQRYPAYVTSAGWLGCIDSSSHRVLPSISLTP